MAARGQARGQESWRMSILNASLRENWGSMGRRKMAALSGGVTERIDAWRQPSAR